MSEILKVKSLSKVYGSKTNALTVVKDINFSVLKGESVAIIGPSGSGKTTLLGLCAGLSGETTASGKNRIDWVLRTVPDIFILELGANDGLRGLPLKETPKNLQVIIDKVKLINPEVKIVITGMEVPPNLGEAYTRQFRNIFSTLAKNNAAVLIPFLLVDVAGRPSLNLPDGIHPTPEGHLLIAELVWETLLPLLELN